MAPPKPAAIPPANFLDLIMKQGVNGCFDIPVDPARLAKLKAALAKFKITNTAGALATLFAIFLLQTQHAARKDEWEMVRKKAVRYLGKVGLPAGEVDSMIAA